MSFLYTQHFMGNSTPCVHAHTRVRVRTHTHTDQLQCLTIEHIFKGFQGKKRNTWWNLNYTPLGR